MVYAIVQKELIVPSLDQVARAFSVCSHLTKLDAQTTVNDAYGILLRGQELADGQRLQEALRLEKIETELVEEHHLPSIPSGRVVRQVELHRSHLRTHDPMQRISDVAWEDVIFMAAGYVRTRDRKHRLAFDEPTLPEAGSVDPASSGEQPTVFREDGEHQLLLDLFVSGGGRYTIQAEEFSFAHLGERRNENRAVNFVALVQDLAKSAPNAGQNRGAYLACQDPPELFPYPSKATFNEEVIWMLWRIGTLVK
jgi:hypothetical protein